MRSLVSLIFALLILLALAGCPREEEGPGEGQRAGEGSSTGSPSDAGALPGTAGETQTPRQSQSTGRPGGAAERPRPREEIAPVELPLELLGGLPEEPNWAKDARIGELRRSRVTGDPQALRATAGAESFLQGVVAGEALTDNFYDLITAESLVDRLRSECDGFRLGVAQRLPQGEWAVPFRCLLGGDPVPLKGTLYLELDGGERVVDGTLEYLKRMERFEPESVPQESTPF